MSNSFDKQNKLIKNTAWFTIGTLLSKIITFLLVPLYTNVLTTEQYSISDIIITTISLATPFFSLIITEAVLRFTLDKKYNDSAVFTFGLEISVIGSILLGVFSYFAFKHISVVSSYWAYFFVTYVLTILNTLESEFLKGKEKVRLLAIVGIFQTFALVASNIIFLVILKKGIEGYLLAYIISYSVANIAYIIFGKLYKYLANPRSIDIDIKRDMMRYSIPMIPNSAMWWITNSSDRYLVTYMVSVAANGIMSVSYKIPSMLSIAISVFMSAWQISVVEDFDTKTGKEFFNNIYEKFVILALLATSLLIICSEFIATFMYAKDFFIAWKYSALLLLGFNFHAIAGFLGTAFTSAKNTKPLLYSTLVAAIANIVLNIALIKCMGTIGAVISTVISYFLSYAIRRIMVKKYVEIVFNVKIVIGYIVVIAQLIVMLCIENAVKYIVALALFCLLLILNIKKVRLLVQEMKNVILKTRRK